MLTHPQIIFTAAEQKGQEKSRQRNAHWRLFKNCGSLTEVVDDVTRADIRAVAALYALGGIDDG